MPRRRSDSLAGAARRGVRSDAAVRAAGARPRRGARRAAGHRAGPRPARHRALGRRPPPLHPLSNENAYGDPALAARPRRTRCSLRPPARRRRHRRRRDRRHPTGHRRRAGLDLPFAFVRKPGYLGHEDHEPRVPAPHIAGQRVLLVDDAVSSARRSKPSQTNSSAGANLVGVFVLVDMRDVATVPDRHHAPDRVDATYPRYSPQPPTTAYSTPQPTNSPSMPSSTTGPTTTPAGSSSRWRRDDRAAVHPRPSAPTRESPWRDREAAEWTLSGHGSHPS